jgi:hypothetical protein
MNLLQLMQKQKQTEAILTNNGRAIVEIVDLSQSEDSNMIPV